MNNSKDNFRIIPKKYICIFCDFKTHKKYNLDMHKRRKHKDIIQPLIQYPQPVQMQQQVQGDQPSIQIQIKHYGYGIQSNAYQAPTSHCASGPEIATTSYQDPAQGVHPQSHHTDGDYPTSNQVGCGLIDTNPTPPSQTYPQHVSIDLFVKYRNTLFKVIGENENLRTEKNYMMGELHSLMAERSIKLQSG